MLAKAFKGRERTKFDLHPGSPKGKKRFSSGTLKQRSKQSWMDQLAHNRRMLQIWIDNYTTNGGGKGLPRIQMPPRFSRRYAGK